MMGLGYEFRSLALRRSTSAGPVAFSPLSTSPSAAFDASETSSIFQDLDGTIPVTSDSQPIGLWQDLSSNANALAQPVSAARPSYRTDGTLHWLETDGVDDALATAPVFSVGNPMTIVLGYQMLSTSGTARVNLAEVSKSSVNGMSLGVRPNIDRLQYYSRMAQNGVSTSNLSAPSIWGEHDKHVVSMQATSGHVTVRMDGVVVLDSAQQLTTESIANQPLRVGLGYVTGSIPGAFRLYGLQAWTASAPQPNTATLVELEQWMANKMGLSL